MSAVHILASWRDDVETVLACRNCGAEIRVGDAYRVVGIHVLCVRRPLCTVAPRPVAARPPRIRKPAAALPLAVCRCGAEFRQRTHKGRPQQACSRACAYRLLEERAAERRRRVCAACSNEFTFRSSGPKQMTCSPSCGAALRERRKREMRAA